ncbi:MAG: PIN domain-containing protein [Anaerosomatales bacterium]|nr:PIN domain-containing protein [Anaerosomatales bacterium]
MAAALVDTNVLVYLFDGDEPVKRARATTVVAGLAAAGAGCVSTQVLGEFFVVVSRKFAVPLSVQAAATQVARFAELFDVLSVDADIVAEAVRGVAQHGLAYFDAQIWAAALVHGVPVVLSEDFQDGRTIEGVSFRDPFDRGFRLDEALG